MLAPRSDESRRGRAAQRGRRRAAAVDRRGEEPADDIPVERPQAPSGIADAATFGASATSPATTPQRSFTGATSDEIRTAASSSVTSFGRSAESFATSVARAL
jgi:hypothetical protein